MTAIFSSLDMMECGNGISIECLESIADESTGKGVFM